MKIIFLALLVLFLSGCEKSFEEQQAACVSQGKKFYVKKMFVFRTGKYEDKGICE